MFISKERSHGVIAVHIRENLTIQVPLPYLNSTCDTQFLRKKQLNTVICIVYRPPDTTNHTGKFEDYLANVAILTNYISVFIFSFFNFSNVRCPEGQMLSGMTHHQVQPSTAVAVPSYQCFFHGANCAATN